MNPILRLSLGVLLGLAILVGAIWCLGRALGDHERKFQGKPGVYWFEQLSNRQSEVAGRASDVLNSLIIPYFTNEVLMDTNDSEFRLTLVASLNGLPGMRVHFTPADGRRTEAVNCLGNLGAQAGSAIPALVEVLKRNDEILSGCAALALVKMHAQPDEIIPVLINSSLDHEGNGRPEVVEALGQLGPQAKAAVPRLLKLLDDRSSKEIRWTVPQALKKIDPEASAKAGIN